MRSRAKYLAIRKAMLAAAWKHKRLSAIAFRHKVIFTHKFVIKTSRLTVPLIETIMVPIREPKRRPADMVNGIAGIARI